MNYKNGVKYIYKFIPNKLGSNFYYFEASNALGKARAAIIDSPDNGPVLFDSTFAKNEIAVVYSETGQKVLSFQTKEEWVGGIALSDDGKYLAAKTSNHVYPFDTQKSDKPLWEFQSGSEVGGDVKGGVVISGDGSRIFVLIGSIATLFNKNSNFLPSTINNQKSTSAVCGNNMCDSDFGETRENCPKDCSEGN